MTRCAASGLKGRPCKGGATKDGYCTTHYRMAKDLAAMLSELRTEVRRRMRHPGQLRSLLSANDIYRLSEGLRVMATELEALADTLNGIVAADHRQHEARSLDISAQEVLKVVGGFSKTVQEDWTPKLLQAQLSPEGARAVATILRRSTNRVLDLAKELERRNPTIWKD